jgi:hypothetical protein
MMVKFTMSDALMKSCKKVEAIKKSDSLETERASLEVLRLAQKNLDRLEQEIAAFKKKHPGLIYPAGFASELIRPVDGCVFEGFFHCARVSFEQGSYEEALKFARSAGQFSVSRDDAWEVRVATEVLDVVRLSYQGLGNMEAFAAVTMDQARMCGALGLDSDCRVKILCEAAAAQSNLEHCTDAIASASEALRIAETPRGRMLAHCTLGGAFLEGSDEGVGLLHFEEAEKLAKVHGRGDFFDPADFAEFREAVAFGLRRCRKIVAHQDEVAEDAFDLAAIGCERAPLPVQP